MQDPNDSKDAIEPRPSETAHGTGERARVPRTLRGTRVAPGLAIGPVRLVEERFGAAPGRRIPLDEVEAELNRFHQSLERARRQIEGLRRDLAGRVPEDQARILDTHLAYLRDSVFVSDVENLILNEQLGLTAAIGKVVSDFDRIFHLVENERLRERAVDLRDVGLRVLRCLDEERGEAPPAADASEAILAARTLSIVDMFTHGGEHVLGIVTEEGALTSHAAILARSMRIPTLTAVAGLLDEAEDGDLAILDATEGVLRLRPDPVVLGQFRDLARSRDAEGAPQAVSKRPPRTRDGAELTWLAACGSLPELERAVALGFQRIGLFRTELPFLVERRVPSEEALRGHYAAVLDEAGGRPVTFRLLAADSGMDLGFLHEQREPNPALGRAGIRALLARDEILRLQLRALLTAKPGAPRSILVPLVTDVAELRAVREVLFEERRALRSAGVEHDVDAALGVVIETPAAALSAPALLDEAEFAVVGLDSLLGYVHAADRQVADVAGWFETVSPPALGVLEGIARAAREAAKPVSVFGGSLLIEGVLPLVLGTGLRALCISPVGQKEVERLVPRLDLGALEALVKEASSLASIEDVRDRVGGLLRELEEAADES